MISIEKNKRRGCMMGKYKMFISHSSKDSNAVNAFVDFLLKIGMSRYVRKEYCLYICSGDAYFD